MYFILVLLGLLSIYSTSNVADSSVFSLDNIFGKQILWVTISVVLGSVLFLVDVRFFEVFSYWFYGIWLILLVLVIFLGREVHGARSWFELGGFRLQPAEFAKFGVALALSKYISDIDVNLKRRRYQLITSAIILAPMVLIVLQGDAGSSLVFLSLVLVLYREGLSGVFLIIGIVVLVLSVFFLAFGIWKVALILLVIGAIVSGFNYVNRRLMRNMWLILIAAFAYGFLVHIAFNKVLEPHQQVRILVMLGLKEDPQGYGYNVNQSKIAIGSGGFIGKGWNKGTQTKGDFVPEQHTDFIFTSVGEEYGWLGSTGVILVFTLLFLRLIFIAERQKNKFSRVYAYAVVSILFFHFLINIGMTINLAPVIGIPLPFFSYGGSSLISFTMLLFLLLRLDANRSNELDSVNY
ncbi:MAG: rod shape determining protein RodA [Bacteroidia bacterium]|jgi:rod shape determining protein RodA